MIPLSESGNVTGLRARTIWRAKQWWYERPGGAFDREMEDLQNGA